MTVATSANSYDVIVVGLGAHGSATVRALAARGVTVLGIDRFSPPHAWGSSHGETRITRQAVGEGEAYAPLVLRSHEIWRELEADTKLDLLVQCGGLVLAPTGGTAKHHGHDDFLSNTITVANRYGIDHEVLTATEIGRRFPQLMLRGDERGYYEPGAGLLHPERCIEAQLRVARAHGAHLRTDERVLTLDDDGSSVTVGTDKGSYRAAQAVVAAGAWIPELAGGTFAQHLKVHRQTLHWFEADDITNYSPDRFPVFIWMWGDKAEDYFYGFPVETSGTLGVKVATEQYGSVSNPDSFDHDVSEEEQQSMYRAQVAPRLRGVGPRCIQSAACLYTTSTDSGFLIDQHPEYPRITVVSACSGHGFKHSAGLGEAICNLYLDDGKYSSAFQPFLVKRLDIGA
ncbi:Monomeric sarcosine oxidase [Methylobacterium crusticola]|uniref:Monomeric sarcosine oxidase n=1 Tax=Methylobacterium crusticola TaxID=1697972 RepID=A0ABQ4QYZ9_9HYPH|nr:N-methyl-L-tryptophan oxidase [Methylobacterium crusticola]GJD49792.1 Monomeric sarcosine oxidase [Methylobacterium crusticola]